METIGWNFWEWKVQGDLSFLTGENLYGHFTSAAFRFSYDVKRSVQQAAPNAIVMEFIRSRLPPRTSSSAPNTLRANEEFSIRSVFHGVSEQVSDCTPDELHLPNITSNTVYQRFLLKHKQLYIDEITFHCYFLHTWRSSCWNIKVIEIEIIRDGSLVKSWILHWKILLTDKRIHCFFGVINLRIYY